MHTYLTRFRAFFIGLPFCVESLSRRKYSLPGMTDLPIGRDVEIEEVMVKQMENFLNEDVKSDDPRYCHCKLCTSSDESNSLKLALSLATSLAGRQYYLFDFDRNLYWAPVTDIIVVIL